MKAVQTPAPQGNPQACLAARRASRQSWLELAPGKRLQVLRPPETEWGYFRRPTLDAALQYVIGWDGFTEADILGAAVGSSDPMPFHAPLLDELLRDSTEWSGQLQDHLVGLINAHIAAREAAEKN